MNILINFFSIVVANGKKYDANNLSVRATIVEVAVGVKLGLGRAGTTVGRLGLQGGVGHRELGHLGEEHDKDSRRNL